MWLLGHNLGVLQDNTYRDSGLCGMDSDFDNALDGLHGTIPNFDVTSFTSKDIVPLKAQHVLASALLVKVFKIWKLSLT